MRSTPRWCCSSSPSCRNSSIRPRSAGLQIAVLGLVFTLQGALIFGCLGYFSGTIGQWLSKSHRASQWLHRIAGSVFIALGLKLILHRGH